MVDHGIRVRGRGCRRKIVPFSICQEVSVCLKELSESKRSNGKKRFRRALGLRVKTYSGIRPWLALVPMQQRDRFRRVVLLSLGCWKIDSAKIERNLRLENLRLLWHRASEPEFVFLGSGFLRGLPPRQPRGSVRCHQWNLK